MKPLRLHTGRSGYRTSLAALVASAALLSGAGMAWGTGNQPAAAPAVTPTAHSTNTYDVVPEPVILQPRPGSYSITRHTAVYASGDAAGVGAQLASELRRPTGYPLPLRASAGPRGGDTGISLRLADVGAKLGDEGYQLDVTPAGVTIRANKPAGLFDGVQTLRQLLPAAAGASTVQRASWTVPDVHIVDYPRFAYRGAMLDVARHFFPVADVERYIDEISLYKVNYLHLHLTDDQGWRIVINGWPNLATYGGSTEVGGGKGGYYTQAQYKEIVAYAAAHFITIVPEVDGPGHTNAALASYAKLNCDGKAPPLYTGTNVGFSSLCVGLPITYTFLQDVLSQFAALTPGTPYLHVGGDEAHSTTAADYATFESKELPIVTNLGKSPMAWQPGIAAVQPPKSTVLEYWNTTTSDPGTAAAAKAGNKIVMAPANKAYLDQKYNSKTILGLNWAAYIEVKDAYDWDPGNYVTGVGESSVLGVEAPLWSETLVTMPNIEYMAFPRLPAIAELGWSPESTHDWASFSTRLGAQGPRWTAMGMNFYASPQVPWAPGTKGGTD